MYPIYTYVYRRCKAVGLILGTLNIIVTALYISKQGIKRFLQRPIIYLMRGDHIIYIQYTTITYIAYTRDEINCMSDIIYIYIII